MKNFKESDFEKWFSENPVLPDGERLVLLSRQVPLKSVVDLLLLEKSSAKIVLIEVKNETATIRSIGQIFDYLAQFEDLDFDTLIEDFELQNNSVNPELVEIRKRIRHLSNERRIIIAAPDFDFATKSAQALLNERFSKAGLSISLLRIKRANKDFRIEFEEQVKPVSSKMIKGKHGLNKQGRLFHVLDFGMGEYFLNVGKLRKGKLALPSQTTKTNRLVRVRHTKLIEYSDKFVLDTSRQGTWWAHKNSKRHAVILGETKGPRALVYIAFLTKTDKQGWFTIREKSKFRTWFPREVPPPEDWRDVVKRNVAAEKLK